MFHMSFKLYLFKLFRGCQENFRGILDEFREISRYFQEFFFRGISRSSQHNSGAFKGVATGFLKSLKAFEGVYDGVSDDGFQMMDLEIISGSCRMLSRRF